MDAALRFEPETSEELAGFLNVSDCPVVSRGYAEIYQGVWTSPQGGKVTVAVKELKSVPQAAQEINTRVKREVFVWAQIKHPNLHPVLAYRSKPHPGLISAWCFHGNITDFNLKNPGLSRLEKLRLLHQAASGLDHLHSQTPPICHAAIRPANVLINDRLEAALSDFGLSRLLQDLGQNDGLTSGDRVKGTFNYTAPELFNPEGPSPGCETDVYAFGGLILAVMSGKPPFWGLPPSRILFLVMKDQQPRPEDHADLPGSDPVWGLMRACWNKDPTSRPVMRNIMLELERYISREQSNLYGTLRLPDTRITEATENFGSTSGEIVSSYKEAKDRNAREPKSEDGRNFTYQSGTLYDQPMREESPRREFKYATTSSRAREEARAERENTIWKWEVRHGRGFIVRNKWFQMPIDLKEYDRWDIQHDGLEQAIGLWYQSFIGDLIPEILAPREGPAPRVVDIGTGSGKWAIEIARAFPHAEVLGIDYQKPPMNRFGGDIPANCRFEQDDVNLGLEHYTNTFDILHARIIDLGIDDYPSFLYDMARILRPGGIIILFKPSVRLWQCHGRDVNGEDVYLPMPEFGPRDDPPGYQLQKVMCLVNHAVRKRGGSEDAWMYYREMLEANPNFESESIKIRWLNVPVCLFPPSIPPEHLAICHLMVENMKRCCDSWTPMLIEDGYSIEEIQRWKKLVHEELETKQTKAYGRWTFAVAARAPTAWTPPPTSRSPTNSSGEEMIAE